MGSGAFIYYASEKRKMNLNDTAGVTGNKSIKYFHGQE
jgi:hypothetical protein